jgi:hypothetical protein
MRQLELDSLIGKTIQRVYHNPETGIVQILLMDGGSVQIYPPVTKFVEGRSYGELRIFT